MDIDKKKPSGYHFGPPWFFRGRALYQLHLVKAKLARAFVPKELKLVELFGYTLGGMFLAHYEDSPAGKFDELVIIAGIVWNPPTSCAWAARVLVNSPEACLHGRKEVGLPSHLATFEKVLTEIEVVEDTASSQIPLCNINLPFTFAASETSDKRRLNGHPIKMSLPSFSGQTEDHPGLLKYSCEIQCRVRPVQPATISYPGMAVYEQSNEGKSQSSSQESTASIKDEAQMGSISILLSRPLLTLEFNSLEMQVGAPQLADWCSKKSDLQPRRSV